MTQLEADRRDAKRYRMMRALLCAPDEKQQEVHALIAPILSDDSKPQPQRIDRALDLILSTLKIV